jgi:hypothetical protein
MKANERYHHQEKPKTLPSGASSGLSNSKGHKNRQRLSREELRTICFLASLLLAGSIVFSGDNSPQAWGFLGVAIGALFGQFIENNHTDD